MLKFLRGFFKTLGSLWSDFMIKKISYGILCVAAILMLCYVFQPMKKGSGVDVETRYEELKNWLHLPTGIRLGNPTGISMDTSQNLVVFHRAGREWPLIGSMPGETISDKTIFIIDKDKGTLLESWGDHVFVMPHGLKVDQQNHVWVTDVALHQVFQFTHDGQLLLKIGVAGIAGDDSLHFNQPTDVAIAADGSFYVSDGYGNNRIIKFSEDGKYLGEWGARGDGPGAFNVPHGICLDDHGNVYVADRENNRIQKFNPAGKFIGQYSDVNFANMTAVGFDPATRNILAVDDLSFLKLKHRGSDVFIFDSTGQVQSRWGRSGSHEGAAGWYHDITVDKKGNIYVGDILNNRIQKFCRVAAGRK
jgi:peptidylamidoglycolate lyase